MIRRSVIHVNVNDVSEAHFDIVSCVYIVISASDDRI